MKHFKGVNRAGKAVLASVLSLAMAIPSVPSLAVNAVADEKLYYGDVDKNGAVEAADALAVLKHVVKLQLITDETSVELADMDANDEITASDALEILKTVVGLVPLREYEEATPTPEVTPTPKPTRPPTPEPTPIVRPTLPPAPADTDVPADPANVVAGSPVTVLDTYGAAYDEESGVYTYLDETNGIEAENPFAGNISLRENPVDLLTASTAAPDHDLVWDLPGASMVSADTYPDNTDPRVTRFYAPEAGYEDPLGENPPAEKGVTYTRPEWKQGLSFSFWAKSQDEDGRDTAPALSIFSGKFVFVVRLNGSVYFEDYQDAYNFLDLRCLDASSYNEWNYYTVTVKNDWVQVYVNGKRILYQGGEFGRKKISHFNDGFLTRYNANGDCEIDLLSDIEHYTYYTMIKGSDGRTPYYLNTDVNKWMTHDNYTIFGNSRYRGVGAGATLMMDYLTNGSAELFIGGTDLNEYNDNNMIHNMKYGSQVANVEYYESELTPEQVAANFAAAKKPADVTVQTPEPTGTPGVPTPTPEPTETVEPTPTPTPVPDNIPIEGITPSITKDKTPSHYNQSGTTTIDENTGVITYNNPVPYDGSSAGVVYDNPAAQNTKIVSSMNDALYGQEIITDAYKNMNGTAPTEWNYLRAADGTFLLDANGNYRVCIAGDPYEMQSWRNNYRDVYYGELDEHGYTQDPLGGTKLENKFDINNPDPSVKVTTFARPHWTTGMSYSFWYKPTADESYETPVLTMFKSKNYVFYMDVKGSVFYTSLVADTTQWFKGEVFADDNSKPYNCFAAIGDPAYVKLGQWNYYTVTFANDMITVYINGEEVIYKKMNMNRGDMKEFNGGFLTRFHPIGLRFVGEEDDPVRQYVTKSGYLQSKPWDTQAEWGANGDRADDISIRSNGVYTTLNQHLAENDAANSKFPYMMIDLFAGKKGYVVLGGYDDSPMDAERMLHQYEEVNPDTGLLETKTTGWNLNSLKGITWCTDHTTPAGAQAYDLTFYEMELKAGNVKENYKKALVDDAAVLGLQ